MSNKRIQKEYSEISQNPPEGFTVTLPPDDSLRTWHVTLSPPPTSTYSPGRYAILLNLPVEYPFKPPTLHFATRIYHPNVTNDDRGNVCLAILKPDAWKPSTRLLSVLDAVRNLLVQPLPEDPLEESIAQEYMRDRPAFEKNVKANVKKWAMDDPVFPAAPSG